MFSQFLEFSLWLLQYSIAGSSAEQALPKKYFNFLFHVLEKFDAGSLRTGLYGQKYNRVNIQHLFWLSHNEANCGWRMQKEVHLIVSMYITPVPGYFCYCFCHLHIALVKYISMDKKLDMVPKNVILVKNENHSIKNLLQPLYRYLIKIVIGELVWLGCLISELHKIWI